MGASESSLSSSQKMTDEITTVTERSEALDPILEKLKSLKITRPILTSTPKEEGSLNDILVRKASSSSAPGESRTCFISLFPSCSRLSALKLWIEVRMLDKRKLSALFTQWVKNDLNKDIYWWNRKVTSFRMCVNALKFKHSRVRFIIHGPDREKNRIAGLVLFFLS